MNYEKYENKIKELLANENIKYNEEELEKVVRSRRQLYRDDDF